MAYIERRRRKSGWMVRYRDPAGRVHGKAFRRKIDAEHFAVSIETEKIHGTWTDPGRGKVRIEDWAATWLGTKVDLRKSSKHRLEGVVRTHILPEFGDYPLNRVGNSDVRLWVAKVDLSRTRRIDGSEVVQCPLADDAKCGVRPTNRLQSL